MERDSLVKLSKYAISAKSIESQRVLTCLRVFGDETIAALKTHTGIDKESAMGTINFLRLIDKFWKIECVGADIKFNDQLVTIVRSSCDHRLEFLLKLADIANGMSGNKHIQQLTRGTGRTLSQVCRELVDLTRYLLECGNSYVILGWFTTDPLRKAFGELRQGSGRAYFITAASVIENINKISFDKKS